MMMDNDDHANRDFPFLALTTAVRNDRRLPHVPLTVPHTNSLTYISSGLKALDGDNGSIHIIMPTHAGWKKRAMDINNRDEGIGGVSGIVLSLDNGGSDL